MALAVAGGWFSSAVLPNLLEKLANYLNTNFNLHDDTKDLLETLTNTLMAIKCTIDVVESCNMIENQSINDWLRKLKLIAYEAEDLIDTFQVRATEETIKAENKVSNFASSSLGTIKNMLLPDEDFKQLQKITKKFNEVSGSIGNLINLVSLMNKDIVEKQGIAERRESISLLPGEMELVGRERELSYIFDLILDLIDKPQSSNMGEASSSNTIGLIVIPIVGLGGVGKTALAQVVYNNQQVKDSFPLQAWVCSSDTYDIKILMEKTIQNLHGYLNSNMMSLEYVTKKMIKLIQNRKFFLVFDDVSKKIEDQWDVLYATLSYGSPRSIVIITTQNRKFADRIATLSPIVLDTLGWEEFLKLFYRHTFGNATIIEEKKGILESIAEKLHGLPLAAKIIGNLLRFKIDENEWTRISKSEWWNISEGIDKILPSVGLNYQYLKPSLRQCFAYCSIFPNNYLFHKDRLVQMWIAHNFIPINNNGVNRLEDIGRQWFDELVDKSFLQPAWDNSRYVMHNLMRDLAIAVSTDECFLLNEDTIRIPQNIRHLALETDDPKTLRKIHEFKQLRTILYFGHCKIDGMYDSINQTLSKSKNVRVLDLSHMHMQKDEPPIGIKELSHLCFLDLSSTGIKFLSNSFEHYHLQTLYLEECNLTQLPKNMNNLINLRHLYASPETISLIHGIGKLTSLQELYLYAIGTTDGHRITELKEMNEISVYTVICGCENIRSREEARQAKFMNKKYLNRINFDWSNSRTIYNKDKEILEGLEPYKGITDLKINNYMSESFPNWVMQLNNFSNLKYFEFAWCTQIDSLPPLGQLHSLNVFKVLSAHSIRDVGDQFYGNTPIVFPALKHIMFSDMPIVQWTQIQARQFFPNLSRIELINCKNLKDAPLISFSPSLKDLQISNSDHFTSLSACLQNLTSLTILYLIECTMCFTLDLNNFPLLEHLRLKSCPEMNAQGRIKSLVNLRKLEIDNCPSLFSISIPESLEEQEQKNKHLKLNEEGLRWLSYLDVDHSLLDQNYPLILAKLPSLQFLHYKNSRLDQFTIEQDAWFRELTSVKKLTFSSCDFEHLPNSLTTLPFLKKMTMNSCIKLISLPEAGMPKLLRELCICQCSMEFTRSCQPPDGANWPKISHVPYINIDNKTLQNK